ncbi:HORMA domain-containing protein [Cardiosporidium cionae]|uniref:HORMA domain-containing protein n=1 Tax=Cardiosporidium cionae TaxID=476202 RepID=A0ABQ7JBX2_9APIC|nr:HORMA domain-containing protein [Cardiosporidium cionae]|eukprot:KAF8821497.1 HORMA domain-containing protein [Cardiosporidium cionae]
MATAVALKPAVELLNQQQSINMLKNTIRIGISSIAYLRNLFEEDVFDEASVSGLTLKQLKPSQPEANMILNWLNTGVFDAMELHYLRLLVFGIHGLDDNLIECYHFSFKYSDEQSEVVMSLRRSSEHSKTMLVGESPRIACSKDDAREQSVQVSLEFSIFQCLGHADVTFPFKLLKSLILLTQSFGPLPECRYISMKLWYYDEKIPDGYEPKGFRAVSEDELIRFNESPLEAAVGQVFIALSIYGSSSETFLLQVDTGYHNLSVRVKTTCEEDTDFAYEGVDAEQYNRGENCIFYCPKLGYNVSQLSRDATITDGVYSGIIDRHVLAAHFGDNLPEKVVDKVLEELASEGLLQLSQRDPKSLSQETEARQTSVAKSINSPESMSQEMLETEAERLFNEATALAKTNQYVKKDTLTSGLGVEEIVAKPLLERMIVEGVVKKKAIRGKGFE